MRKQSDLRSGSGAAQGRRARGPAPPGRALPAIYIADYTYEVDCVYDVDIAFTKASWIGSINIIYTYTQLFNGCDNRLGLVGTFIIDEYGCADTR